MIETEGKEAGKKEEIAMRGTGIGIAAEAENMINQEIEIMITIMNATENIEGNEIVIVTGADIVTRWCSILKLFVPSFFLCLWRFISNLIEYFPLRFCKFVSYFLLSN